MSSNNSDTGFFSRVKSTAQSFTAAPRPWRDFLDLSSFNLPISLSDATTRISQNLTHFRVNYTIIVLSILFLSLIYHPFSLIVFLLTLVAWFFFYFGRDVPLTVFGFHVDDRAVAAALFVVTVIALVLTHVWVNVLVSVGVGVGLVILHAGLRSTDDLVMDDQESPYYGVLLDDVDGDGQDKTRQEKSHVLKSPPRLLFLSVPRTKRTARFYVQDKTIRGPDKFRLEWRHCQIGLNQHLQMLLLRTEDRIH